MNDHIDVFLRLRLKEAMPMIGMLIGDRTISQLKSLFMEELETLFPSVIKSYFMHMKNDPSLDELIRERIDSIDMHSAQKFFKEKISTQVTKFNLLAGVLGFLIGCLQLLIIIISLS